MGEQEPQNTKKHICAGLLAHVDAGKTTLAEALLYTCGQIRNLGRVDHRDAFLDNFSMERERGITIFSKQACCVWEGLEITLLDTPGHVDFCAEMERTLQVLDYCILVISGSDGVQAHTLTLWKLLKQYQIPVFLFINKMDQAGTDQEKLLLTLQEKLSGSCLAFGEEAEHAGEAFWEEVALCGEDLMEEYLETGKISRDSLGKAIADRKLFPCYFGAALKLLGVEELLRGLRRFCVCKKYPKEFGARVYKISRDPSGNRLTHLKVTGGALRVKMPVSNKTAGSKTEEVWEEKADQLRIYAGAQYQLAEEVFAGEICAVTGLDKTYAGQGLGIEREVRVPILAPVLTYGLGLPEGSDVVKALGQLKKLEEEEPELHVVWREAAKEIHVQVMGEVQIEVLKRLIAERFGLEVEFTDGQILYKETIAGAVEGIGHFEPLRHYAEVHLLLEPGEPGSGLYIASACSEDVLDRNWQRLVMAHLEEKTHLGVLTGSPITDMKITLLTGRGHLKHTEGGDFRQATCRALRQGLMQAQSVLLEPVYAFRLEMPTENLGRAMSDIRRMHGSFNPPVTQGAETVLTGSAPASAMRDYQREVNAWSRGRGRLSCTLSGYEPCHNTEEVIRQFAYDPEADLENPSASVFCAHGAGFVVSWDKVSEYAHLESGWKAGMEEAGGREATLTDGGEADRSALKGRRPASVYGQSKQGESNYITQEEIEEIFRRTYGKGKEDYEPYRFHSINTGGRETGSAKGSSEDGTEGGERSEEAAVNLQNGAKETAARKKSPAAFQTGKTKACAQEQYLLVDGYNIIFAWEDLRSLAEVNIDSARDRLMDICSNYQGYVGGTLILVFDAYKVKGGAGSVQKYHNIYVVYTKEAETADMYIEKTVHRIGRKYQVAVATSDRLEQMIIWGEGAARLSAANFREAVEGASKQFEQKYAGMDAKEKLRPFEELL